MNGRCPNLREEMLEEKSPVRAQADDLYVQNGNISFHRFILVLSQFDGATWCFAPPCSTLSQFESPTVKLELWIIFIFTFIVED